MLFCSSDITFPGTHDSGTYRLDYDISVDAPKWVIDLIDFLKAIGIDEPLEVTTITFAHIVFKFSLFILSFRFFSLLFRLGLFLNLEIGYKRMGNDANLSYLRPIV